MENSIKWTAMTSLFAIFRMKSAFAQLSGPAMWKHRSAPVTGVGIFGAGIVGGSTLCDKYNFSANTNVAGPSLGGVRWTWQATGNTSFGVFAGGSPIHNTEIYTYAGDVVSAGTDIGPVWYFASVGNATQGIYAGGRTGGTAVTTSHKYVFSSHIVGSGGNLGTPREAFAGVGISTQTRNSETIPSS